MAGGAPGEQAAAQARPVDAAQVDAQAPGAGRRARARLPGGAEGGELAGGGGGKHALAGE
ncbi:hypothetical protein [Kouleothrix sp.]|uniref:hypothetical protein n=1 Tax=Kouleothrix sp. TaxID=2779161 RepID=UPI00391DA8C0